MAEIIDEPDQALDICEMSLAFNPNCVRTEITKMQILLDVDYNQGYEFLSQLKSKYADRY